MAVFQIEIRYSQRCDFRNAKPGVELWQYHSAVARTACGVRVDGIQESLDFLTFQRVHNLLGHCWDVKIAEGLQNPSRSIQVPNPCNFCGRGVPAGDQRFRLALECLPAPAMAAARPVLV